MKASLRVDFHCHSNYSLDSINSLGPLLKRARKKGLDRLVITDHNTIQGALVAKEMDPELVIVGEEIVTTGGELLASFVTEKVPRNLPPLEAIARLRDQGAFISVSHPFDRTRRGWQLDDLEEIVPLVDAIEIFNSRCIAQNLNPQAQEFAQTHQLAGTVGSDAHILSEIGSAALELPYFESADELRQVIRKGVPDASLSPAWVHFISFTTKMVRKGLKKPQKA